MTLDVFLTPHLRGDRLTSAHLSDIRRIHQDADVMAMLGGVRDAEQTATYLERNLAHWDRYGHGVYVVHERASGDVAGLGCLRNLLLDADDEIEIGYSLFPAYWGRGLATEIARACLELGFSFLGRDSLVAVTHPENRASQRVMEKVGMAFDRETTLDGHSVVLYRGWRDGWERAGGAAG